MKQEMNYSRYVDRYLEGVMNTPERIWFEKELDGNHELQQEINLQKKLNIAIADKELIALQQQMNVIHRKTYGNIIPGFHVSKTLRNMVAVASGVAAVMTIVAVILVKNLSISSSDHIYAQYFQPASINMSLRSTGNVQDNDLRSAMTLYDSKKYDAAIQLFEKILKQDDSRIGLNLYSGISYMEIKQYAEANARFRKIIDQKSNAFIESAQWYLGLCYLKTHDNDKAKDVFSGIANGEGYYKKDARRILKIMN
jgi:tetratricopeptide (TPR) repeat protein